MRNVVHLQGMRTGLNAAAARVAQRHGVPVVVSPHGQVHPWLRSQRRWRKAAVDFVWDRPICRRAALGVAMTEDEAEHLRAFSPGLRVEVVPIGIDPPAPANPAVVRELLREHPGLATPRRRVFFLANFNRRKGYDLLIDAFARLGDRDDIQLVMAGAPGETSPAAVRERVAAAGISEDRFVQLPRVDAARRAALLSLAEVFAMPSRSENFGIVVLEALAAGVPVLATDSTPWASFDPAGEAVLSRQPTVDGIRDGLGVLLGEDGPARAVRVAAGERLLETRFRWEPVVARLEALYREVAEGRRRGP